MCISNEILKERFTSSFDTFNSLFQNSNDIVSLEYIYTAFLDTVKEFQKEIEKTENKKLLKTFEIRVEEIKTLHSKKWSKVTHKEA
jgi:hypothetical protein